jgi:hypothetical protein
MLNKFIIDAHTNCAQYLKSRLMNLKTTWECEIWGSYAEMPEATQVVLKTTWTEDQLDKWLYKSKGIESFGIAAMEN